MNCGSGSNIKAELLALWYILYFAHFKKVTKLQLVGDSKVIIDWFKQFTGGLFAALDEKD
jgi:hypothetical protein